MRWAYGGWIVEGAGRRGAQVAAGIAYTRAAYDTERADMVITGVGWVYLAALAGIAAWRRAWLPPLLLCAAMLHAPAVAIIGAKPYGGGTGISPWFVTACVVCVHLLCLAVQGRGLRLGTGGTRRLVLGWSVFFAASIASAFVLPWLFAGVEVHALGHRRGFGIAPTPLAWSMSNLVQAVNSALLWGVMLYLLQVADRPGFVRRLGVGLVMALAIGLGLALYQRAHEAQLVPAWTWFESSLNPSYVQRVGGGLQGIARVAWPFPEPSYAAVAFAGVWSGGLAVFMFTRRHGAGLALAGAGAVGVGNSLGIGGMAAAMVGTLAVLALALVHWWREPAAPRRERAGKLLILAGGLAVALLAGLALARVPSLQAYSLPAIVGELVAPRLQGVEPSGSTRAASLLTAAGVLRDTVGLGAGLGSNRASSYLASLFSNLGIVPGLLFLGLLGLQARSLWRMREEAAPVFVLFGGLTALVGVALAIPDLNWPAWWTWILASFALCVARAGPAPQQGDVRAP